MHPFIFSTLFLLLDITFIHLTHYPLISTVLAYYIYLLVTTKQYALLFIPGTAYALESLLLQDTYSYNLLILLAITYLIIGTNYCLYRTLFLALILIFICTCFQGLGSSIYWGLPYDQGLIYTSWLISANIGVEIAIWYIFEIGKRGNRSKESL